MVEMYELVRRVLGQEIGWVCAWMGGVGFKPVLICRGLRRDSAGLLLLS